MVMSAHFLCINYTYVWDFMLVKQVYDVDAWPLEFCVSVNNILCCVQNNIKMILECVSFAAYWFHVGILH